MIILSEREVKDKCKIHPHQNQMCFVAAAYDIKSSTPQTTTEKYSGKGETQRLITIIFC
jgi:hypothetical protein